MIGNDDDVLSADWVLSATEVIAEFQARCELAAELQDPDFPNCRRQGKQVIVGVA